MIEYKIATLDDIEATLKLHKKYQIDTIKEEDKKMDLLQLLLQKRSLRNL